MMMMLVMMMIDDDYWWWLLTVIIVIMVITVIKQKLHKPTTFLYHSDKQIPRSFNLPYLSSCPRVIFSDPSSIRG